MFVNIVLIEYVRVFHSLLLFIGMLDGVEGTICVYIYNICRLFVIVHSISI